MAVLGRKPSGNDIGFGVVTAASSSASRASIMGRPASNGWAYRLGGRLGYNSGSSATLQLGVYATSGGNTVTNQLATTSTFTVNAYMADAYSGADYTSTLATALQLYANSDYALAVAATSGTGAFGQDHSGLVMHDRNAVLPNPYGATATSPQGKISIWAEYQPNRAPNKPTGFVPASGEITSDATPTIGASFTDADETLPGVSLGNADKMKSYRLEVWNSARTSRLWDTGKVTASDAQQTARKVTADATTLDAGTYYARATFWDQFDTPSPQAEWAFTVNAGGAMSGVDAGDDGSATFWHDTAQRVHKNQAATIIGGTWTHSGGLALDLVQYRLSNGEGSVLGTSAEITASAAVGVRLSAWSDASGLPNFSPGATYTVGMRGRDTTGLWSPWNDSDTFHVNAPPNIPTNISPSGSVHEARPELGATLTDGFDTASTLIASFAVRAQGDTGDGLEIPLARQRYSGGRHYAQPDATEMAVHDVYEWRVRGTDPWGDVGAWSAWQTITYATPPAVTITTPADGATLTSGTPTISGTTDKAITAIAVLIREVTTGIVVVDTGTITASGTAWSYDVPGASLRNNTTYDVTVTATSTEGLDGAATVRVSIAYPAPAALTGVTVNALPGPHEPAADSSQWSRIYVTWDAADAIEVADADFAGYVLRRVDLGTGLPTVIAKLGARADNSFTDKTPRSGVAYRYDVTYLAVRNTVDVVESEVASGQASVSLRCAVLTSMDDDDLHVPLRHWSKRSVDWIGDEEIVSPIGTAKPIAFRGATDYARLKGDFTALDDPHGTFTARDLVAAIRLMKRYQVLDDGELAPRVILYRDQRRSMFCVMTEAGESDHRSIRVAPLELELVEVDASEGVDL